jgi:NAD(P)-dependent dehydrogenase (short-subunit alcohol dehydrogenase family)
MRDARHCVQGAAQHARERWRRDRQRFLGQRPDGGRAGMPYAVAKHGILGLTKTAAVDTRKAGVRVNAVAPDLVDSPLTARIWDAVEPDDREVAERERLASIPPGA